MDVLKVIWDNLFIKGSIILFKAGLVILNMC